MPVSQWVRFLFWVITGAILNSGAVAEEARFSFPLDCKAGETCFLQNFVDIDPTDGVLDTLCRANTYDGHKGIDIRVPNLSDMETGVRVIAMADGVVKGLRDEMRDEIIENGVRPFGIKGRECGNGVVLQHADGYSTQYCHMKLGSLAVKSGDTVKRGDTLGEIGVSGASEFPHVHVTIRAGDDVIDPFTGEEAAVQACSTSFPEAGSVSGLFSDHDRDALLSSHHAIIGIGLSDRPFDFDALVRAETPPVPTTQSKAVVGWGWVINARVGDRMRILIENEKGVFSDQTSKPLARRKATYFTFAGRRTSPEPGSYKVTVSVLRDDVETVKRIEKFEVR